MYICPQCGLPRLPMFHHCFAETLNVSHIQDEVAPIAASASEPSEPIADVPDGLDVRDLPDVAIFDVELLAHLLDARVLA